MNAPQMTFAGGPTYMPPYLKEALKAKLFSPNSLLNLNSNSKEFKDVVEAARDNIRVLLNVPNHSQIWFLGGGAHLQFAGMPLNYAKHKLVTNYTTTGYFSKLSFGEAKKFSEAHSIMELKVNAKGEFYLPEQYDYAPSATFTHFIDNQSVEGVEFHDDFFPVVDNTLLFDDCSSSFLTKSIDWSKVDMAYAHAQKNCGTSGLTIMIANQKCLQTKPSPLLPEVCSFKNYQQMNGYYADMSIVPIYSNFIMSGEILKRGGLAMNNYSKRANRLYEVLDKYPIYKLRVQENVRSRITVTWRIQDEQLSQKCIQKAAEEGLHEFKGHRTMGGFRACLFAPIPDEAVYRLADYLEIFAEQNQ